MKRKLIAIVAAVVIAGALGVAACGNSDNDGVTAQNNAAVAYGILHKEYAGRVSVIVDSNKKIQDVHFDEFLPIQELGNVVNFKNVKATTVDGKVTYAPETVEIDAAHKQEVVTGLSKTASTGEVATTKKVLAKFIKIGGKMFELKVLIPAEEGNQTNYPLYGYVNSDWTNDTEWILPVTGVKISNQTDTSGDTEVLHSIKWFSSEGIKSAYERAEFTKFYMENMEKGEYYICKDAAGTQTYEIGFEAYGNIRVTKATWANKNVNGYWTREANQSGLGWRVNMEIMRSFLINEGGFDGYLGSETLSNGSYKFGDKNTGATLVSYHEYMGLAKTAYTQAIELFA